MIQLNNNPPPLPQADAATSSARGGIAAWLGLGLAIAAGVGSLGYEVWIQGQDAPPEMRSAALVVVGILCASFAVLGAVCSGVSLFTAGSQRGVGLFLVAGLGVLLNVGQIGVTVAGGAAAVKAHAASLPSLSWNDTAALREFQRTSNQSRDQLKEEFAREGYISEESDARHADTLMRGLDKVEKSTSGDTAKAAAGLKSFLAELHQEFSGYQQEAQKLVNLEPMDPTRLRNKADLQMRKSVITAFQKQNDEVEALMNEALPRLRRHLLAAGLSERAAQKFLDNLDSQVEARLEIIRQIRDTDRRIATTIGEVLALYEAHWQEWKLDPAGQVVDFENPEADAEVKRLFEVAGQAVRDQIYWQERYLRTL